MSEFSFDEAQNYESLVASYAPFPGAQLVEVAVLSEDPNDPKVGIYRADNGTENGEDLIVMLPYDFPEEPVKVGVDINDFDPRRQQPPRQYFVPKPELPVDKPEKIHHEVVADPAPVQDLDSKTLRVVRPPYTKPQPYFSIAEFKGLIREAAHEILMLPEDAHTRDLVRGMPGEVGQLVKQTGGVIAHVSESVIEHIDVDLPDPRQFAAGIVTVGMLASGLTISSDKPIERNPVVQEADTVASSNLVVSHDEKGTFITFDNDPQDPVISAEDAAYASGIPLEFISIEDGKIYFNTDAGEITQEDMKIAYLAASKPEKLAETRAVNNATLPVADVFASQRDNGNWGTRPNGEAINSSNTCNLTALTMAMQRSGIMPEVPSDKQPEEVLVDAYLKDLAPNGADITEAETLADIARANGGKASIGFLANTREEWGDIQEQLNKGKAAIFSINGHVLHLSAVTKEGLVVDDPAGATVLLHETSDGYRSESNPNYRDTGGKPWYGFTDMNSKTPDTPNQAGQAGDNNLLPWADVDQYANFKWLLMVGPNSEAEPEPAAPSPEISADPEQRYNDAMQTLLNEIASHEGGWDSVNTGHAGDTKVDSERYLRIFNGRRLSQVTINEVLESQARHEENPDDPNNAFTAGKFQFIPGTLRSAVESTGIDRNRLFDPAAQDELAINYLILGGKRPDLAAYIKGESDDLNAAVDGACMEWASLPCSNDLNDRKGRLHGTGYYDGDGAGNNAAGGEERVQKMTALLQDLREAYIARNQPVKVPETPAVLRKVIMGGDSLTVGMQNGGKVETIDEKYGLEVIGVNARVGRALEAGDDNGMDALKAMQPQIDQADIVYWGYGTNPIGSSASYRENLQKAFETIGSDKTIVIPHIFSNIAAKDERNVIIDEVAAANGAHVIDVADAVTLSKDRIHPTRYADLAARVMEEVSKIPITPATPIVAEVPEEDPRVYSEEEIDTNIGWVSEERARSVYTIWFGNRVKNDDGSTEYVLDETGESKLNDFLESEVPHKTDEKGNKLFNMNTSYMPGASKGDK